MIEFLVFFRKQGIVRRLQRTGLSAPHLPGQSLMTGDPEIKQAPQTLSELSGPGAMETTIHVI